MVDFRQFWLCQFTYKVILEYECVCVEFVTSNTSLPPLFSMPCRMSHASIPAEVRKARQFPEDLIRLCVGIEDVDDLLEDLHNALTKAGYAFPPPQVAASVPLNPV